MPFWTFEQCFSQSHDFGKEFFKIKDLKLLQH